MNFREINVVLTEIDFALLRVPFVLHTLIIAEAGKRSNKVGKGYAQ